MVPFSWADCFNRSQKHDSRIKPPLASLLPLFRWCPYPHRRWRAVQHYGKIVIENTDRQHWSRTLVENAGGKRWWPFHNPFHNPFWSPQVFCLVLCGRCGPHQSRRRRERMRVSRGSRVGLMHKSFGASGYHRVPFFVPSRSYLSVRRVSAGSALLPFVVFPAAICPVGIVVPSGKRCRLPANSGCQKSAERRPCDGAVCASLKTRYWFVW